MITAWSSDQLADWLSDQLADAPADPFSQELVVVPTPGMETYLTRRLARRLGAGPAGDGVAAGIRFLHPGDLVAEVAAGVLGDEPDPWRPERLQWLVLAALDSISAEPDSWADPIRSYLDRSPGRGRRLDLAREAARLLANYSMQRPALIEQWAAGLPEDGVGNPLPAQHVWQYHLFCRVREAAGALPWPVRLRAALGAGAIDAGLPPRLTVFGPTRLGELDSAVLVALAKHRDVTVCAVRHAAAEGGSNPLMLSLGREEASGLRVIEESAEDVLALPGPTAAPGLLGSIQASVSHGGELPRDGSGAPAEDRSFSVHSCAGDLRQVEAVRDEVLHLMSADPALEPRDVLVMCTDLERFGPLIAQVFGTAAAPAEGPTHDLRVRIADRAVRAANPVLGTVLDLLTLLTGRMTATEVTDFLASPLVSRRFGLSDDTAERVSDLVASANVRWGLGPEHREQQGTPAGVGNTWATGLDRLALGLAVDGRESGLVGGVAPAEALGDQDGALVGALLCLHDTLAAAWQFCRSPHPAAEWGEQLADWAREFAGDSSWELPSAAAALTGIFAEAATETVLSLPEVRDLVADEAAGYAPLPDLLAGGVAVAAMRPMRNIPFRVICLVGMDDGSFPRSAALGGNDVLAIDPQPGERDPRAEDRQLLLDALCAARSHLVITYSGFNPASGKPLPPAAPLAELLADLGPGAGGHVVREHPLTPFDTTNFADGALGWPGPYSHDRAAAAVASASPEVAVALDPPAPESLAAAADSVLLHDLVSFWKSPGKQYLRHIGLATVNPPEAGSDELVLDLDGLQRWQLGQWLLTSGLRLPEARELAAARGDLPVHDPDELWSEVSGAVTALLGAAAAYSGGPALRAPIDVLLSPPTGSVRLTGSALLTGGTLLDISYSSAKPGDSLRLRIEVAALAAAGHRCDGVLIRREKSTATRAKEPGLDEASARARLETLLALRASGLVAPLPFAPQTSTTYAETLAESGYGPAIAKARQTWTGSAYRPGESAEPEHQLLWDGDFDELLRAPAWPDWPFGGSEPHLFGQLARIIFDGGAP